MRSSVPTVIINSISKAILKSTKGKFITREVHYRETFVCFICNEKFRTHKELPETAHKETVLVECT
jgi:hypothetical protein